MNRILGFAIVVAGWIAVVGCGDTQVGGSSYETGNALAGRVLDSNGRAVAGAAVKIRPYWHVGDGTKPNTNASEGVFDLRTDSLGSFEAKSVPAGDYRIELQGCRTGLFVPRKVGSSSGMNLLGDLELRRLGAIEGKVALPAGATRAMVQVYGTDRAVSTESDGSFALQDMPAGEVRVRAVRVDSELVLGESGVAVEPSRTKSIGLLQAGSEDPGTWKFSRDVLLNTGSGGVAIGEKVHDLPVLLRLDSSLFPEGAAVDGRDLRVVDASGGRLPHELEGWDPSARHARIWVRVDTVLPDDSLRRIRVVWGRSGVISRAVPESVWDTANGWSGVWHLSNSRLDSQGRSRTPDATAWKMDGILTGTNRAAAWMDPIAGRYFDGSSDVLRIGGASTEFGTHPFTLEMWIRPEKEGVAYLNKGMSVRDPGMRQFYLGDSNATQQTSGWRPSYFIRPDSTRTQFQFFKNPVDSGKWSHLTMRMSPSTTNSLEVEVDWFVDGIWSDSSSIMCKVSDRAGDSLGIGDLPTDGVGRPFKGWMGELRVSRVARSDAWIRLSEATQTPGNRFVRYLPNP